MYKMSELWAAKWSVVLVLSLSTLSQLSSTHPCGENPLRRMASLTRILNEVFPNRDIDTILETLQISQPEIYRQIQAEWRIYANCVGLVDTGYFKRSSTGASNKKQPLTMSTGSITFKDGDHKDKLLVDVIQGVIYFDRNSSGDEQEAEEES